MQKMVKLEISSKNVVNSTQKRCVLYSKIRLRAIHVIKNMLEHISDMYSLYEKNDNETADKFLWGCIEMQIEIERDRVNKY